MTAWRGTFQSLHVRNFRLYFAGQLVSQVGTWMQTVALNWLVLRLSDADGFLMGLALALQFLPTLVFGVWGGAVADRFDKRTVLVWTQVAMAAVAVALAVVDLSGAAQLWMIYVLVTAFGFALVIDNPTRQAFVPELVPPTDVPNAVGLSVAALQLARVLGPALAGALIVTAGTGICFALNGVSFVFVIVALHMMRPAELHRSVPLGREKGQLRQGLAYMWHNAALRSMLLLMLVVGIFAINAQVVLPLLAEITFHGGPATYGWMTAAMGSGAIVGALFAASRTDVRGGILCVTGVVFGVCICVASLAPTLALFLAFAVVVGAAQIAFLAISNSCLQLISDPSMRGRVMSVYTITLLGTTPIGAPLVGWISEQFGPRWAYAIGGIATLVGLLVFGTAYVRARRVAIAEAGAAAPELVFGVDGEAIPASVR